MHIKKANVYYFLVAAVTNDRLMRKDVKLLEKESSQVTDNTCKGMVRMGPLACLSPFSIIVLDKDSYNFVLRCCYPIRNFQSSSQ